MARKTRTVITVVDKEELELLQYKEDLLFQLLLLMSQDRKGNYRIDKEHTALVEEATRLYLSDKTIPKHPLDNDEHSGRLEERI
jgi:hypothetical protein